MDYHLNEELPLPYRFDLVHYDSLDNLALKQQIDAEGKPFYDLAEHTRDFSRGMNRPE